MSRKCQKPECSAVIWRKHLLCSRHWQELPEPVRREAQVMLNAWKSWDGAAYYLQLHYKAEARKQVTQ